ncbi:LOW QUALITY PROTEIN: hypothetical protein OSB04_002643 [Centaurea solstitialis]|uniref:Uncharacterized protein n=1 Tax=Centaurea solstitialis TaxID=347529 RepID=A0AA38WMZ6_9ASTR|nr:LOW QUALITY PROTEIN: hypothetical protein OSB04_002643 [Centaurea solstitialis]
MVKNICKTISPDLLLLQMILKKKTSTEDVWVNLEPYFVIIKKLVPLNSRMSFVPLSSVISLSPPIVKKIKTLSDLLANVDPPENLLTYLLNGLTKKYENMVMLVWHQTPPPTFVHARSMLLLEEQHLTRLRMVQASHVDH